MDERHELLTNALSLQVARHGQPPEFDSRVGLEHDVYVELSLLGRGQRQRVICKREIAHHASDIPMERNRGQPQPCSMKVGSLRKEAVEVSRTTSEIGEQRRVNFYDR